MTRSVRLALLLLSVSIALRLWTAYRTDVSVLVDGTGVSFTVDGRTLKVTRPVERLSRVEVRSRPSADPMGASDLTLVDRSGEAVTVPLPRRFSFASATHAATSDWWVDSFAREETLGARDVHLAPPVRLSVRFRGRSLMPVRLVLFVPQPLVLELRSGFIRNELAILDGQRDPLTEAPLEHSPARLLRNLLDLPLRGLSAACLLLLGFAAAGRLSGDGPQLGARLLGAGRRLAASPLVVLPLLLFTLGLTLHTARDVLEELPHFPDDFCYVVQARWLLAGRLWLPLPAYASHLDAPYTFHDLAGERWLTQYPVGWPLLLSPALAAGLPWALPPVLGALGAFVVYRLARDLHGPATGFVAALLAVLSPLMTLLSSSLLSHAAAALLLGLFVLLYLRGWPHGRAGYLLLAGLSLGYAFGMRPLSAVAAAAPAGLLALADLLGRRPGATWRGLAFLVAGGVAGTLPTLVGNALVTGSPFVLAYQRWGGVSWLLSDAVGAGLHVSERSLALMGPMAFGWGWDVLPPEVGLFLTYAFALVPFLTRRATRADALLAATFVSVALAHLGHGITGAHGYGPRFYADVLFALFVLSARGITLLAAEGGRAGPAVASALVAFLAIPTAFTLPRRHALYEGYNMVTSVLEDEVARQNVTDGVLVLERGHAIDWTMAARLVPGDYEISRLPVVAGPWNDPALARAFPGRDLWVFTGRELVRVPASERLPPGPSQR